MNFKSYKAVSLLIIFLIIFTSCGSSSSKESKTKQDLSTPGAIKDAPKSLIDFYEKQVDVSKMSAGDIIYSQPLTGLDEKVNGWRVLYVTTALNGSLTPTSALVYEPRDNKKHNVVVWAHGTLGMADECAPSRDNAEFERISYMKDYLDDGNAIIAPDYEGFGTPGVHPFLVGNSEGRSVLDSIRMAQKFDPISPKPGSVIIGHSQGGQAALFAGQLRSSYAPDANVAGIVAIAPAGELKSLFNTASKSGSTLGLVVMAAVGYQSAYSDLDLTTVLTPSAIEKSSIIETGCLTSVANAYKDDVKTTFAGDPTTLEPWASYLDLNSPGKEKIDAPLYIVHGLADLTVPSFVSQRIFESSCTLGTLGKRVTYAGADHTSVLEKGFKSITEFTEQRFEGKKFNSEC